MRFILFSIGPLNVYGYGFMIALGVFAALLVGMRRAKKYGLDPDIIFNLTFICVIGGFAGAKILYVITEFKNLLGSPTMLRDISNGFVVYGGIIGGIFIAWIYCRHKEVKFLQYFDMAMPSVAIAQGFGRLGCFFAGCCYGRETHSAFGMVFRESPFAPNDISVIPTQLISSVGDFIMAALLILYAKKNKHDGAVGSLYLVLYGVGRFLIEYLRDDPRGTVGIFSTSQFISVFVVAAGILLMFWTHREKEA